MGTPTRIVILGGGFAGALTAKHLERRMTSQERQEIEVTLVSRENYLTFQPLLPEVISGTIGTLHCITPIRRLARKSRVFSRTIEAIDIERQVVRLAPDFLPKPLEIAYDHLVVGLGARLNYSLVPGMREHAIPFKYLGDALRLRNEAVRRLEAADIEANPEERRRLLTFVVAGGGFSGVECLAELNDFLRKLATAYRTIGPGEVRCVLLQSGARILPELSESLASYAHQLLERRGIEIRLQTRLKAVSSDAVVVQHKGSDTVERIATRTVVTTVPAAPDPLVTGLPFAQDHGRLTVNEFLHVPGQPAIWALGDCAAVPQRDGITSPPTAQHASRQAQLCATNILAQLRGRPLKPFLFTGLGKLASLGHRAAVAEVLGVKFRGIAAWVLWRSIYLAKLPGWDRKLRVACDWLLDCILPRDITQVRIFANDEVVQEHFHAGEVIFDGGDYGDRLYSIARGEVEIVLDGELLATLRPGQVFGEIALVSDLPRTATARAKTDVDVVTVSRHAFEMLVAHLPGVRPAIEELVRSHGFELTWDPHGESS